MIWKLTCLCDVIMQRSEFGQTHKGYGVLIVGIWVRKKKNAYDGMAPFSLNTHWCHLPEGRVGTQPLTSILCSIALYAETSPRIILCMCPANERWHYTVTPSLIGWRIHRMIPARIILYPCKDHSVYVPSQWEMALHCNAISHWLGAYTEWSLHHRKCPMETCCLLASFC